MRGLEKEWQEYLAQTENHVRIVRGMFEKNLDPEKEAPGRTVVRHIGQSHRSPHVDIR